VPPVLQYYRTPFYSESATTTLLTKAQKAVSTDIQELATEQCFNVELTETLSGEEEQTLKWLLQETYEPENLTSSTVFKAEPSGVVVEVGPRMNFSTAFSTNAVSICRSCGIDQVKRLERSRRFLLKLKPGASLTSEQILAFANLVHDRMTECVYVAPLTSFANTMTPEEVKLIPVMAEGRAALESVNKSMGLAFDEWDLDYYTGLFKDKMKRDPTNVELFDIAQSNSEHSRHWFFKANLILDGEQLPHNLMELVSETLEARPDNSVVAFKDNSSAIRGNGHVDVLYPQTPGGPSKMEVQSRDLDLLLTAETHNFPCAVAPYPGAETGAGGRIRDTHATGKGSIMTAATAGYCVGNLNMEGYPLPGDTPDAVYPGNLAPPEQILIDSSNGASDYGNKFGEPLVQGYTRTFGVRLPNGERREWLKPIMFSGGVGAIDHAHLDKDPGEIGMKVVKIGGPAYRIGMGGGAASSMTSGTRDSDLDFNAVQRGDGEMAQKLYRVVRSCVELGDENPIVQIHDQGAGGNCNVVKELIEPLGAKIDIRAVKVGDETMSVLDIWGAEYQENDALLIKPETEEFLQAVCDRERLPMSVIGTIDGSGRVTLVDRLAPEGSLTPEDLDLDDVIGALPRKTYHLNTVEKQLIPVTLPTDSTPLDLLHKVLALPGVCSKRFLTTKVDRSVTGQVAQQQCVGPLQLPISDVGVISSSVLATTGTAFSIGEQPIKGFVSCEAMGRLAVAEALTNMVWAKITSIEDIKASGNWMWAAKMDGEGAELYRAAISMRDAMVSLGMAIDGGKDSLSMAAQADGEAVKGPGSLVISAYVGCPDVTLTVTPDLKLSQSGGKLIFVDIANGKRRLGGSALAQAHSQVGDEVPDVDDLDLMKRTFNTVQDLIAQRKISAGHDVSDGGAVTAVLEMAFAGNCGVEVDFPGEDVIGALFAEEPGLIIEVSSENEAEVMAALSAANVPAHSIGQSTASTSVNITVGGTSAITSDVVTLRDVWEATSFELERKQASEVTVREEEAGLATRSAPKWNVPYTPTATSEAVMASASTVKVAVVREEGSNGDREMCIALHMAGMEVHDITMSDLQAGTATLDAFRGVVFPGGFSYADVLDSAKGWAGGIRFNERIKEQFENFYKRTDTFSLGVCNGCQLMALLGWVPGTDEAGSILPDEQQPRLVHNSSGRFESRWSMLRVEENNPCIWLKDMAGANLGVWVAHGEGQVHFPDSAIYDRVLNGGLAPLRYTDDSGKATEEYPRNPNGSPDGIAALCSPDGRHLALMPHPERCVMTWQMPYVDPELNLDAAGPSPWLKLFQNARQWCDETN